MFADFADDFVGSLNPLARAKKERLEQGLPVNDYASGSVHDAGLLFPQAVLKDALDRAFSLAEQYRPDSKGQSSAREAIARYYAADAKDRIVLTPGTSQSYWYIFNLLANAGDEIVVPRPCYPLFEYIATLCKVRLTHYDLEIRDGRWQLDTESLSRALTSKTRGIVLISPHNPTGHVLSRDEVAIVQHIAADKKIPLIIDEVFYEFVFRKELWVDGQLPQRRGFSRAPLVFTVNGFSKMFALPGMKIGWIKVDGEEALVTRAVAALETIADTFLATNEIAQFAVPDIFENGKDFLKTYVETIRHRWEKMKSFYSVEPDGGFYGVTFLGDRDEDVYTLDLLRTKGVLVHPGYFFDLPEPSIVFSFVKGGESFVLL